MRRRKNKPRKSGDTMDLNATFDQLMMAVMNGNISALQSIPEENFSMKDNSAIQFACQLGRLDVVKFLCDSQNVDLTVDNGYALRTAVASRRYEVVKYLLENHYFSKDALKIAKEWAMPRRDIILLIEKV